eukprot:841627-Rhodomonas_salina.1
MLQRIRYEISATDTAYGATSWAQPDAAASSSSPENPARPLAWKQFSGLEFCYAREISGTDVRHGD